MGAIDQIEVYNTGLTKEQVGTAFSNALNLYDNVYTKTQADVFLAAKVNKETGKDLSSNDYTDDEKAIVEGVFGHGSDLESGDDLDDITDPGAFYAGLSAAANIDNMPDVLTEFRLEVIKVSRLIIVTKIIPLPVTGNIYYRSYDGTNWSSWFVFTGTAVV